MYVSTHLSGPFHVIAGKRGENINNNWYYQRCEVCGALMLRNTADSVSSSDNNAVVCSKCAKLHNETGGRKQPASQSGRKYYQTPAYNKTGTLFVEHDPVPVYDGGFRRGTPITWMQAEYMRIYHSFNAGTILVDEHMNRYEVLMDSSGKQELIRLDS